MTKNTPYYNDKPSQDLDETMPVEVMRAEFAKRLYQEMTNKGWNQSELARNAALYTDNGKFGRDSISLYIRGVTFPNPKHLEAMCKALGVERNQLVPTRGVEARSPFEMRDMGNGTVWIRVAQATDWDTALKIVELLKGSK